VDAANLVEIENKVKLAHIPEVFVQCFDKQMDYFKKCKLIIVDVTANDEVKAGIPAINELNIAEL